MGRYSYKTTGTCSKKIVVDLEGRTIQKVLFTGGCSGNLRAISRLIVGMDIDRVIECFKDVRCADNKSSCPAQLAIALREAYEADQAGQG